MDFYPTEHNHVDAGLFVGNKMLRCTPARRGRHPDVAMRITFLEQ